MKLSSVLMAVAAVLVAVACGGGGSGGGTTTGTGGTTTGPLAPMIDSFGTAMTTAFDGGEAGAAGANGTAADGKALAFASVRIVDSVGRNVFGTTDANGVYHLRIDGFVPPMIASVTRPDGSTWYSPSVAPVVVRGFINISINGLTDKLVSDVAVAAAKSGAGALTPALLASHLGALQSAKSSLNQQLAPLLALAGLSSVTFDAVTSLLVANHQGYDYVLDHTVVTRDASGMTRVAFAPTCVVITPNITCN